MGFVHLHLHTEFSLLDGAARISRLAKECTARGMNAVAVTDHGNMYGAYKFYKSVKEFNKAREETALAANQPAPEPFKAILGCEIYIVNDLKTRIFQEHIGHLLLLAKNNAGYINLCKINSKAWLDGFYKKPRIDYDFLEAHSEGLICMSACLAGHIPHLLLQGLYDEAKKYAARLKKIFGEDFYIELQDQGLPDEKTTNPMLIKLARDLNIEIAATNDVHYLNREDADMQKALVCVTTKKTFNEPNDMLMPTDQFYLKSPEEMAKTFKDICPEAVETTVKIAEKCNCSPFSKGDLLPQFEIPKESPIRDLNKYFRNEIETGLKKLYGNPIPKHVVERYETEYKVISENHFVDYFLIVADFMQQAAKMGVATGPGRGSGAGSIIAYALGITRLDPLKYGLIFERFLHSERVSNPDFDLDFCCNRRGEVIDYVVKKYGADHVCQIVTFGTLAAKAAIKDIARVFEMPYNEVDKITKPIDVPPSVKPPYLPYIFDLKKIERPQDGANEKVIEAFNKEHDKLQKLRTPELVTYYKQSPEVKRIVDMAMKVEGFPRNCSTHAAGVIICKEVVGDVTPLQRNGQDVTSQYDMKEVEELGMLKMDFLGLITLTDIQGTLNDVKKYLRKDIDLYSFEYNDPAVYNMITAGDTDAVFQLESGGYKRFMKDLKPDCFEDIIAAMALFRPGPMDMIPDYCRNKHNPSLTVYEHPMLEPILKETYGQIVYQEQVMEVFKVMGGYSLGQADMVRRAMGKKDAKEMEKQKDIFINGDEKMKIKGAVANGVPLKVAKSVFEKMEKFAGYAFNKSHAACYAYIAYQTAWLKLYYYPYYMANVLNNRVHKWDDMTHYIGRVRAKDVDVLSPDVNKSEAFFTVDGSSGKQNIRFGLAALKNVGEGVIQLLLEERRKNGPFKGFGDFVSRVDNGALNKRCLESLIFGGAFDGLGHTRHSLIEAYPQIVKVLTTEKRATDAGQVSMFGAMGEQIKIEIPHVNEYPPEQKLQYEKDVVGLYLSGHPLSEYADLFEQFQFNTSKLKPEDDDAPDVDAFGLDDDDTPAITVKSKYENGARVVFGAIISEVKKLTTKADKKDMAKLDVEDLYGTLPVMVFHSPYEKYKQYIQKDMCVKISGRVSIRDGELPTIMADEIVPLNDKFQNVKPDTLGSAPARKLYIKYNTNDQALHEEIQNLLRAYSGDIPITIRTSQTGEAFLLNNVYVRECNALKFGLEGLVGPDNFIFK